MIKSLIVLFHHAFMKQMFMHHEHWAPNQRIWHVVFALHNFANGFVFAQCFASCEMNLCFFLRFTFASFSGRVFTFSYMSEHSMLPRIWEQIERVTNIFVYFHFSLLKLKYILPLKFENEFYANQVDYICIRFFLY